MYRTHRLLSRYGFGRSGEKSAAYRKLLQSRAQSGYGKTGENGERPPLSRGAILASGACMSALAYLGVLCLAKWSPKARKKLEQYDPVGKAILNMLERQESMIGKSHVAGLPQHASTEKQKENKSAAPAASATTSAMAVKENMSSGESPAAAEVIQDTLIGGQVEADPVPADIKAQDDLEEQLRLAVLEEERKLEEAARLEAQRAEQRQRIEDEAQHQLEESVRDMEARVKAEEEERLVAVQKRAEKEKEAAHAVSRDVDGSLQRILSSVGKSSKALHSLATGLRNHSLALYKVISLQASQDKAGLRQAEQEMSDALKLVEQAQEHADSCATRVEEAVAEFDALCAVVRKGGDSSNVSALTDVASQALRQVHGAAEEVATCRADQAVMLLFRDRALQQCDMYRKEMERLSDTRVSAESATPASEALSAAQSVFSADIQALLSFAQQRVDCIQESLSSGQQHDADAVSTLLLQQREEDMQVAKLKLDHLREELVRHHQEELQKQEVEFQLETEQVINKTLQRQAAAHTEHLRAVLEKQFDAIGHRYRDLIQTALADQTDEHLLGYYRLAGTMQGIDCTADYIVATIREGMKKVDLCRACSTLLGAVRGEPVSLGNTVNRLRQLADGDAVILAALDTIPKVAVERGVQSHATLLKRFSVVKTACSRVAFVGDKEESGVVTYLVSHLSSLLYWPKPRPDTVDGDVDVASLNVPSLLDLAEQKINEGELGDAVRLVNQLTGQPRVVAQDWIDEARLYLTTQQAAEIIGSCALMNVITKSETGPPDTDNLRED